MEEENTALETRERLEELKERAKEGWTKYLAITTALIAVVATLASLLSGTFSNEALLAKNTAILEQSKVTDQWNFYQA